jgi:alpha-tubulin suppressor-like RCC1 family protein
MRVRNLLLTTVFLLPVGCFHDSGAVLTAPDGPLMSTHACELPVSLADAYAEIEALRAQVDALEAAGHLNPGQANALRNHLDNARRHLDAGRICPALAQIRGFREQVAGFVAGGTVPAAEAAPLLEGADRVLGEAPPAPALSFATISAGRSHACGVTTGGDAYCWGSNVHGQLGDGTTTDRLVPTLVSGGITFATVEVGRLHTCGLTPAGAAWCWGINESGTLGDGSAADFHTVPVAVSGGHTFDALSAGLSTCGLAASTAWCWGNNLFGQIGDGTTTDRSVPTAVTGGHIFDHISVGEGHACAVKVDATAWCWGVNSEGALGDGTTATHRTEPVAVSGGIAFQTISAGNLYTCGLALDGTSWCWGRNLTGQLGDGTTDRRNEPVPVSGSPAFAVIDAGSGHTCGLEADGTAFCWGFNLDGRLGDGTTTQRTVPTLVAGGLAFDVIAVGDFTCGVAGAAAYCWGGNDDGQLGDGTTTQRNVPTPVSGSAP